MSVESRTAELAPKLGDADVARAALNDGLQKLQNAYAQVDNYEQTFLGIPLPDWLLAWDPLVPVAFIASGAKGASDQVAAQTKEYLDGIKTRAEFDLGALPDGNAGLDAATAKQVAFDIASIEAATKLTIKVLPQSALMDFVDSAHDALVPKLPKTKWFYVAVLGLGVVVGVMLARRIR
jgi:hypothetical protein